ncbi:hypothetical protein FPQ18DRAFT_95441 [Pyronema domesticum]|nr:hypothetical protein FPQ18DRAFT_95441 [Pyronema domesticum]
MEIHTTPAGLPKPTPLKFGKVFAVLCWALLNFADCPAVFVGSAESPSLRFNVFPVALASPLYGFSNEKCELEEVYVLEAGTYTGIVADIFAVLCRRGRQRPTIPVSPG